MEQYGKSGPPPEESTHLDTKIEKIVDDLRRRVESQDRRINELERDLRRLRNSVRTAIAAANAITSNRQRNG